jgi:hypothetical protein
MTNIQTSLPELHKSVINVYGKIQPNLPEYIIDPIEKKRFEQLLDDFTKLKLSFPNYFGDNNLLWVSFSIVGEDEIPAVLKIIFQEPYIVPIPIFWIRAELSASFERNHLLENLVDWHEDDSERLALFDKFLTDDVGERLQQAVLISNIASPGTINLTKAIAQSYYGGLHSFHPVCSTLMNARQNAKLLNWPPVKDLSLFEVAQWVDNNSLCTKQGNSTLSRAFNAYTHLFGGFNEVGANEILLYSLIGIEAIYNDSKEQVGQQINQKCQTFLGSLTSFKKKLTQMYNYRSGFVHGGEPFPSKFDRADATEEFEEYELKITEAGNLGSMVLISTLQRMSELQLNDIKFRYELVTD